MKNKFIILSNCVVSFMLILLFYCSPPFSLFFKVGIIVFLLIFTSIFIQSFYNKQYNQALADVKSLHEKLVNFNSEIQVASNRVSSISEELVITADENRAIFQQLQASSQEMYNINKNVGEQILLSMERLNNLTTLLSSVKNLTLELNKKSAISVQIVSHSINEIYNVVGTINSIKSSSQKIVDEMRELYNHSIEITEILKLVEYISKQTKLLAINASIESAKSSVTSQGFSVVASEIRKLADESSQSVKNINKLIGQIQIEMQNLNNSIIENSSWVDTSVEAAKAVEENLGNINVAIEELSSFINKIHQATEEEFNIIDVVKSAATQMKELIVAAENSVNGVYEMVNQQAHNVELLHELSNKLSSSSEELITFVDESLIKNVQIDPSFIYGKINLFNEVFINELKDNRELISLQRTLHNQLLKNFIEKYDFIEAIWTNDKKGRFIVSIPPAGIANANIREWFKKAINGQQYVSDVYISAITKKPCVTVSYPIRDENGLVIGVLGVDVKLID